MTFIEMMSYTGTFVFAITGALKARRHQMDIFGAALLAFVTAYGGGTIRKVIPPPCHSAGIFPNHGRFLRNDKAWY
jgi:uncharacterized membrane protein YeiH